MTNAQAGTSRFRVLLRAVGSYQPSVSGWPSAFRRGLLVGMIVAVGAATGQFPAAATIAIGALNLGLVDAAVPRRLLAQALFAVTIITSVIAFLSATLAGTWWIVPLLMVLAYTTGAIGSAGLIAFNTTFMALVTGVLFTNDPGDWQAAAHLAFLVLIGSLLQCVSSLIAWRYEREASIRRGIVNLITELRLLAISKDQISTCHLRAATAQMRVENLIDGARLSPGRDQRYRQLLAELSWTRLCISNWIGTGQPTDAQRGTVAQALMTVDSDVRKRLPLRSREAMVTNDVAPSTDPAWQVLSKQLAVLESTAEDFQGHIFQVGDEPMPAVSATDSRHQVESDKATNKADAAARRTSIWPMFKPGSPGFRHALRLSVAVGLSEAVVLWFDINRGYWIPLTVVMVVKPDFSTTMVRGILRVIGTTAAVIVAGAVLNATHNPQWLMVLLLLVFAPLTMRWMTANYAFSSFAIGITVLLLIEAGEPSGSTIILRLENTLIGVVISLLAYLLWPLWSGDSVRSLVAKAVTSHEKWAAFVVTGLSGGTYDATQARAVGQLARDSMLTARPAVEAAVIEPHEAECDASAAMSVLDSCERAAMATLALEVELRSGTQRTPEQLVALRTHGQRVLAHIDRDFESAERIITGGAAQPDFVASESSALVNSPTATAGGSRPRWPDAPSARAVDMLVSAADSTVSAARMM